VLLNLLLTYLLSTKFFSFGDWGMNDSDQLSVHNSMLKSASVHQPDFYFVLGDNFYYNGVKSDTDPLWTKSYTSVFKEDAFNKPW